MSGYGAGDDNLYRYTGNGPSGATDPSGLLKIYEPGRKFWFDTTPTDRSRLGRIHGPEPALQNVDLSSWNCEVLWLWTVLTTTSINTRVIERLDRVDRGLPLDNEHPGRILVELELFGRLVAEWRNKRCAEPTDPRGVLSRHQITQREIEDEFWPELHKMIRQQGWPKPPQIRLRLHVEAPLQSDPVPLIIVAGAFTGGSRAAMYMYRLASEMLKPSVPDPVEPAPLVPVR
jgi:hypothetical protein